MEWRLHYEEAKRTFLWSVISSLWSVSEVSFLQFWVLALVVHEFRSGGMSNRTRKRMKSVRRRLSFIVCIHSVVHNLLEEDLGRRIIDVKR